MTTSLRQLPNRNDGNITLMTVFLTGMVAFLLVMADNTAAVKEGSHARIDASTEQAFYAAQSCLEDGYLQLRFNDTYVSPYEIGSPLQVGTANCSLNAVSGGTPGAGTLTATGTDRQTIRTVISNYRDAGPSTSRNNSSIFHVLDRSGSMSDQGTGCSDSAFTTQATCLAASELWGPRPFVNVKQAAVSFLATLNASHDEIGVVSYGSSATLDTTPALTTNYTDVRAKILGLVHGGTTNIGGAVSLARANLPVPSSPRTRVMIVLTDGVPNVGSGSIGPEDYAQTESQAAKSNGILVITIGLGNAVNHTLLTNMASVVNGRTLYYPAPNASQLEEIYAQIANVLTTYNIGQGSWTEN